MSKCLSNQMYFINVFKLELNLTTYATKRVNYLIMKFCKSHRYGSIKKKKQVKILINDVKWLVENYFDGPIIAFNSKIHFIRKRSKEI